MNDLDTPLRRKSFAIAGLLLLVGCAPAAPASAPPAAGAPLNVILMIADGAGVAHWTAGLHAAGSLAVQEMPVLGLVETSSANRRVSDSAAGATALAAGQRTFNLGVGVAPACREILARDSAAVRREPRSCAPLQTVLEIARARGMETALVTTAAVVDATPAAFIAKVPHRHWYQEIADQMVAARPDVLLGGGRGYFDGALRRDGRSVLDRLCAGALCVSTAEELYAYQPDRRPLVGLFTEGPMPPFDEVRPTFPQMVEAALARLSLSPNGFFAMFENEGTDDAGHDHYTLARLAGEVVAFDRGVALALEFARRNPRTLVVVTADHETGGTAIHERGDSVFAAYTTGGHTGEMVPLFAIGPGAERFGGIRRNDEIGRLLMEIVGRR